jgi:signal transduction histidine kinase
VGSIRAKLVLLTATLVALVVGGVAAGASLGAGREAEARVRAEIARTARAVVDGGFLRAPETLRRIARFLGAEVAAVRADGAIAAATFAPEGADARDAFRRPDRVADAPPLEPAALAAIEPLLRSGAASEVLGDAARARPAVVEVALAGRPATLALAAIPAPDAAGGDARALLLVYPGHLLSAARRDALRPGLLVGAIGLALAVAAAALLARSFVRPIERLSAAARRIEAGEPGARLDAVRTGDEVEALARALEGMVAGLRAAEARAAEAERLAALGRLVGGLAHEVKNPLAAIRMSVELVAERARGGRDEEALRVVLDEIEKLSSFAAKLLGAVRAPVVHLERAPLAPLVDDVVRLLSRQLEHLGVRVEVRAPRGLPEARLDAVCLRHVLLNLVLNACDAMPAGGRVEVALEARGGALELAVADEGAGVAEADRARLFTPFFSRKPGGTGLGLALCAAIVEAHHGSISYDPRPPRGSIFTIRLPLAEPPLRTPTLKPEARSPHVATSLASRAEAP